MIGEKMFERFTDRSRKVMALSNQEALRFNHNYIGTEHMLLALIKEGSGVGSTVLQNLGLDLRKVRLEVEKLIKAGTGMVTAGKLPQTPRVKRVVELAIQEAANFGHNYVGTEHLLLGLSRETDSIAAQVLTNFGIKPEHIRSAVCTLIGATSLTCKCGKRSAVKITQVYQGNETVESYCDECSKDLFPGAGGDPAVGDEHDIPVQVTQLLEAKEKAVKQGDYARAGRLADEAQVLIEKFLTLRLNTVYVSGTCEVKTKLENFVKTQPFAPLLGAVEKALMDLIGSIKPQDYPNLKAYLDKSQKVSDFIKTFITFHDEMTK